jgi:hypothetical protein
MSEAPPPFIEQRRELNRFAKWALLATCFLLFPIGLVLGVVALWQIRKTREEGAPLALVSVIAGLLAPAVVVAALYGDAKRWDPCFVTRQMDGLPILRLARMLENDHHIAHGRYGTLDEIGFAPKVELENYVLRVEHYDEDSFRILLIGIGPQDGDLLALDESQTITYLRDLCTLGHAPAD